jgi:hypothetical protein
MPNIMTYDRIDCGTLTGAATVAPLLTEDRDCFEVIVQADPDNEVNLSIGSSLAQWYVLEPGATITIPTRHLNNVYVRFPAGDDQRVNWIAMR